MDFSPTEDQQAYSSLASQFANNELAPHAAKWDRQHIFPKGTLQKAGELGFCGLYSPESQGGMGLSRLDSAIIFEQLSMGCTATTAMLTIHNMATWMITTWGQDTLLNAWADALVTGQMLASYCLTEPGAGSDAASLKTRAHLEGDTYVLNGNKAFISGAGETDILVVMARTGGPGAKGISAFAVPADLPGIVYGKAEEKMGWNAQPTRQITFENVKVPQNHLLGELGQGFSMAMKGLDGGRINIAACSLGTAKQALNTAKAYMKEREQFGKAISTFQALQFKLADMATELTAAQQLVYLAADKLDKQDSTASTHCAMAKRFATDVGFEVCNQALQIHGGYGYIKEYPLERHLRDVRVHQILEGTNEIMRVIIARNILSSID